MILFNEAFVPNYDQDLFRDFRPINHLKAVMDVDRPAYLDVTGRIDTRHRGVAGTENEAIMVAFALMLDDLPMPFAPPTGVNILSQADHYASSQILGFAKLQPGRHIVELYGRSASTAAPTTDGLAEIKAGYSIMRVRVEAP